MKEPCGEGLASHTDPESCVVSREAGHEVLTGHTQTQSKGESSSRLNDEEGFLALPA
jgi:hypothetical protein